MNELTPIAFDDALPAADAEHDEVLQALASLYERAGDIHYGEDVTQLEHAVQCASLAYEADASNSLIVAALLHDIGHLVGPRDWREKNQHDAIGASLLEPFFDDAVCQPIRLHADAKRYLCAIEAGYYAALSEASRHSLQHQGGIMTAEECHRFEASEHFEASIALRRWDDTGKCEQLSGWAFHDFLPFVSKVLHR